MRGVNDLKLGIGTVQFGLNYGVSNREGRTPPGEVVKILQTAERSGVRLLDTAPIYGTSEEVLGRSFPPMHSFKVVSKTPKFSGARVTPDDVRLLADTFHESLRKTRQSSTYGLLVHQVDDLLAENGQLLMDKMLELKERGLVQKVGVSVYTSKQIDQVLERYPIDVVQIPLSVLDQRLLHSGHLAQLYRAGVEIHARSVFLQGLLLMHPEQLSAHFEVVRPHLRNYHAVIAREGLSPLQAALGFVLRQEEIDHVLVGVCADAELREILDAVRLSPGGGVGVDFSAFAWREEQIVNPSMWHKG